MGEVATNISVHLPTDGLVNVNLAVAFIFSGLAPLLNGLVILPVLWLKQLRAQNYLFLLSNYLSSTLAIILEFGLYRIVQILRYRNDGLKVGAEETECGIVKFFEFPITTSNFCLFILGFERFLVMQYNRAVNRFVLLILIALPWALGIYRQAFELTSPKSQYQSIPYAGLCVDVTSEQRGKEISNRLLDLIIPFMLAAVTITLAYAKVYSEWRVADERIKLKLYNNLSEKREILLKKRSVIEIFKNVNQATAFFSLRIITTTFYRLLLRQVEEEESSEQLKDVAGAVGIFFLLLETVINPFVLVVFNTDFRTALGDKFTFLRSSLIYPSNDNEEDDELEVENGSVSIERPDTNALENEPGAEETNEENVENADNVNAST